MTTSQINDLIHSLITPYLSSLRGQLAQIDATSGTVQADDFRSLLSWPGPDGQYHLAYNEDAAVLFLDQDLIGVTRFDRSLLAEPNPETKFSKPHPTVLAEGAL